MNRRYLNGTMFAIEFVHQSNKWTARQPRTRLSPAVVEARIVKCARVLKEVSGAAFTMCCNYYWPEAANHQVGILNCNSSHKVPYGHHTTRFSRIAAERYSTADDIMSSMESGDNP